MSKSTLRAAALALAGILITIGGCAESPSAPTRHEFVQRTATARFDVSGSGTASAVIDGRGGMLQTAAGDRIIFPAGALLQPTEITITSDPRYAGVELEPHGLRFPAGREPILQLSTTASNAFQFRSLSVAYIGQDGAIEEILPTVTASGQVMTNLHHFSGYLVTGG